jgi:cullin 4
LADEHLRLEKSRSYLCEATKEKNIQAFVKEFIESHSQEILERGSGMKHMMQNGQYEDVKKMYGLFKLTNPCLDKIKAQVRSYVSTNGEQICKQELFI